MGTPQWREGPLGPKTLCNACGVKRVRAARAALEGRMRMAKNGSGSTSNSKKTIGEMSTRRSSKGKSTAARAAAFILAAIEEKEKEDPNTSAGAVGGRSARTSASVYRRRPAPMAVDQEVTTSQSDDPEEIQFIPPKPPMSPISAVMGAHGVAALGLMSMSLPAEVVQKSITAQLEAHRLQKSSEEDNNNNSSGNKTEQPETTTTANTSESIETPLIKDVKEEKEKEKEKETETEKENGEGEMKESSSAEVSIKLNNPVASNNYAQPPQVVVLGVGGEKGKKTTTQLEDLQNAAAEAAKHAYAADAAVAAVAQVLAIKQAVALKARAEASAAAQRVHAMASLAMYTGKDKEGLGFLPPPQQPK